MPKFRLKHSENPYDPQNILFCGVIPFKRDGSFVEVNDARYVAKLNGNPAFEQPGNTPASFVEEPEDTPLPTLDELSQLNTEQMRNIIDAFGIKGSKRSEDECRETIRKYLEDAGDNEA